MAISQEEKWYPTILRVICLYVLYLGHAHICVGMKLRQGEAKILGDDEERRMSSKGFGNNLKLVFTFQACTLHSTHTKPLGDVEEN